MGLVSLGAGIAIGYMIGTRSGRDKFNDGLNAAIRTAEDTWHRDDVQDFVAKATDSTSQLRQDFADGAKRAAAAASGAARQAEQMVDAAAEGFAASQREPAYDGSVVTDPDDSAQPPENGSTDAGGSRA